MASYGLVRPPIESMFLSELGKEQLPSVWISVALAAAVVTVLYSRAASSTTLSRVFVGVCIAVALSLLGLLALHRIFPTEATFGLYVWKDVYIVVLVEVFWTTANLLHKTKNATWSYGIFLVGGSLGSIAGEQGASLLAHYLPTEVLVLIALPLFGLGALLGGQLASKVSSRPEAVSEPSGNGLALSIEKLKSSIASSLQVVLRSRYLVLLIALVGIGQVVITLVDYQFNATVLEAFPNEAARTSALSNVYTTINIAALVLQLLGGVALTLLGVSGVLLLVPLFALFSVAWVAAAPAFLSAALAKIVVKSSDYSLGRTVKEILYIPLSYAEQTQGKAVADIFSYRFAKGGSALIVGALVAAENWISIVCLGILVIWIAVAVVIGKRYRSVAAEATAADPDGKSTLGKQT